LKAFFAKGANDMNFWHLISKQAKHALIAIAILFALTTSFANAQSAVDRSKILATNSDFYESFSAGNLDQMKEVWSASREVGMIPPGREFLSGINNIMTAFSLMMLSPPKISCQMEGPIEFREDKAIIVCDERLGGNESVKMMNVFAPEDIDGETEWKMIYHGPVAEDKRRT